MAQLIITIPDPVMAEVLDAVCKRTNFANPDLTARNAHFKGLLITYLKSLYKEQKNIEADVASRVTVTTNADLLGIV